MNNQYISVTLSVRKIGGALCCKKLLGSAALVTIAAAVAGCATGSHDNRSFGFGYRLTADYPMPGAQETVAVVPQALDTHLDIPSGAYYDEEYAIVVSGYEKQTWAPPGTMARYALKAQNKAQGKSYLGGAAEKSPTEIVSLTQDILSAELAAGHARLWTATTIDASLQIHPYVVFRMLPSGKARLFAMLRVNRADASWSGRYFALAPGEYEIQGDDGWMAEDRFSSGLSLALRRALDACMLDASGALTGVRKIELAGVMPFEKNAARKYPVILVREAPGDAIGRVLLSDAWPVSGTYVFDLSDFSIADSNFNDPRKAGK